MIQPISESGHYQYSVDTDNKVEITGFLKKYGYSSRLISSIKKKGRLLLNDKPVRFIDKAEPGDIIDIYMPEERVDEVPLEGILDIIYEDDEVLVINKPKELVVHPTRDYKDTTLANIIAYYYEKTGQTHKIRFVNRIDRDTTGIVIVAKNRYVHSYIQSQLPDINKTYLAIAEGKFEESSGTIDLPIYRPTEESIERVVSPEGKPSRTVYQVLSETDEATLLQLTLKTGRTHQIRVHLKAVGHPIIGDPLYNPDSCENYDQMYQILHAYKTEFYLPKTGYHEFTAAPPDEFLSLESRLRLNHE